MSTNTFTVMKQNLEAVSRAVIENGPGVINTYAAISGTGDDNSSIAAFRQMVNSTRVNHLSITMHEDSLVETDGKAFATLSQLRILADKCGIEMDLPRSLKNQLDDLPKALPDDHFARQLDARSPSRSADTGNPSL